MTGSSTALDATPRRTRRGFAGMDPQRLREVSRAGGRAAHALGTAHEFDSQEAKLAGQKSQQRRGTLKGAGASSSATAAG